MRLLLIVISAKLMVCFASSPDRAGAIVVASSALRLESDPRDFLGRGATRTYTEADSTFDVLHDPGFLYIDVNRQDSERNWTVAFQSPSGTDLAPGVYEGAINGPSPRKPGMLVRGEHRTCGFGKGRFVILEAEYGEEGTVNRLAVDFEYHCENEEPGLFGALRINSDHPLPPQRAPTPTPRPDQFRFDVEIEGGYFGYMFPTSMKFHYDPSDSTAKAYTFMKGRSFWQHLDVSFRGPNGNYHWNMILASSWCDDLGRSSYPGALGFNDPDRTNREPVISVSYDRNAPGGGGHTCFNVDGSFTIRDLKLGEHGEVYRAAGEFEQHCFGTTPRIVGSFDYTSTRPTPTPAPPTPTPSDYSSVATFESECGDYVGSSKWRYLTGVFPLCPASS